MQKFIINSKNIVSEKLSAFLKKKKSFVISGVTGFAKLVFISDILSKTDNDIVFIAESERSALKYQNDLKSIFDIDSVIFPYSDGSIYDTNSKNLYVYAKQISLLYDKPAARVMILLQKALFEKFPKRGFFDKNNIEIKIDDEINPSEIAEKLVKLGYKRKVLVADIGEFSIRGDIIDVFPLSEHPYRIELWGNTVTDIRIFDNSDQKSIEKRKTAVIQPVYKFVLNENSRKQFEKVIDKNNENFSEQLENIKELNYFEGIEYYAPVFNPETLTYPELAENNTVFVFDDYTQSKTSYENYDLKLEKQYEDNVKAGFASLLPEKNHYSLSEMLAKFGKFQKIYFDNFVSDDNYETLDTNCELIPSFRANSEELSDFIKKYFSSGFKIIAATAFRARTEEIFKEKEIPFSNNPDEKNSVCLTGNAVLPGSVIPDYKLVFITDKELYNKRSKDITGIRYNYKRENLDFIETLNDIKEGDYVVHTVHGIGIFKGLTKQSIDNEEKDYLTIEYRGGDKLHIPAEQINMLCRYRGSGNVMPALSQMGGNDWNNTKTKVKKSLEEVASDLINLYAVRQMSQGYAFEPDSTWQYEMEDAFEYTETPDQMRAISETKADMESDKPMDRLICGDTGFGKTEVAIRAIFKAVMSSKQAAVVVPTTILAMQHFNTISERFKPFGVKVDLLSRFKSPKEQRETIAKLVTGEVDVVIGTHRLLQDDVRFKDLGLLVIDEEHKFGVRHKEKLKQLKKNIDILSMSATPIPRTLYMSLSGIKDMSVINTAPTNRLPVKTFVREYKDEIVKNAINYELEREGQVFYLYNRVETIYDFAAKLKELMPNVRLAVAHGQTDKSELERIMTEFAEGEYDVLLCTTIIESGLDIPNANTIIIHNADKFGLAQLYQIRGRVGRTDRQAYCYCLYDKSKKLTSDAVKRLNYIREFTSLGSGYQIALRDIEIRGVGNILGTKQHGQMVNVGFDTYCKLLEDAICEMQNGVVNDKKPSIVDINVTAYIPEELTGSKEQKMIEYKRLSDVNSIAALDSVRAEWKDRFAKIPEEVENLIKLVHLRILATEAGFPVIREAGSYIRIYTNLSKGEWNIICASGDKNITKYINYTQAPKSCTDGIGILLLKTCHLNFNELFNILSGLFYHVLKTGYYYKENKNN